jgi:hypothetical protein
MVVRKWILALAVGAGAFSLSGADDAKPMTPAAPSTPSKMPDFAKTHAAAGEIVGEIVKADAAGITLQVVELVPNGNGGYSSGRRNRNPGVKQKKTDIDLKYIEGGMVRWVAKPKKVDDKGKSVPFTQKEMEALQKPQGAPGYAAERTDLQPGHIVEVVLMRPKSIPQKDAKVTDLEIKYVKIHGADPNPPMPQKKEEPKKKN